MNPDIWINRGAAAAVGVCAVLAVTSVVSLVDDLGAVGVAAAAETVQPRTGAPAVSGPWSSPKPVLRAGANSRTALDEYLNGQLGPLGLTITSITPSILRPLGGGLTLAEVRIEARGEAPAAAAVAQWVAVNREAVRLKSLSMGLEPGGDGVQTIVLLVVLA
jgi:hypothetical protein